jgi:hypothetical protein
VSLGFSDEIKGITVEAVAAGIAVVGVVIGAVLGARSTRSQWLKDRQLMVCQRLIDEYGLLYEKLALSRRDEIFDQSWVKWNRALTGVSFVCAQSVVEAAYALDEQMWRADWAIRGGQTGQQAWLQLRRPLDAAHAALVQAIRRQTNRRFGRELRTSGRPLDADPMWQMRQRTTQDRPLD